jgi:hypothetical protein
MGLRTDTSRMISRQDPILALAQKEIAMSRYSTQRYVGFGALFAALTLVGTQPLAALTMKECSSKYRAAQASGTVGRMTWQDFRKTNCGATAAVGSAAAFPRGISSKYGNEPAGKARMHTCLDQYNANKVSNRNGGLRWIEKGGGYYSECNKRLKG